MNHMALTIQSANGTHVGVQVGAALAWTDGKLRVIPRDAVVTPWRCAVCGGDRVFFSIHAPTRCATCVPPTQRELEIILADATARCNKLARLLENEDAKCAVAAWLDERVCGGDPSALVRLSLNVVAATLVLEGKVPYE